MLQKIKKLGRLSRKIVRLAKSPARYLFKRLMFIEYAVTLLRNALQSGGPEAGKRFLKKYYRFYQPASAKFLIGLYEFIQNLSTPQVFHQHPRPFVIHFCCWGESYALKAKKYLIPSLLAEGNLPFIARQHKVIILINCDKTAREIMFSSGEAERLKQYAELEIVVLPEAIHQHYRAAFSYPDLPFFRYLNNRNDTLKYLLLGAFQTYALRVCHDVGAIVSFQMPDVILSDNFYKVSLKYFAGKKLVGTSTFRTDYHAVAKEVENFYTDDQHAVLSISAAELSGMQVKYLHPHERRRVISEKTKSFLPCARLIFKTDRGLVLRALQYHPFLVDCQKMQDHTISDYCPIDDTVLTNVLTDTEPYEDQVWLCADASMMNIMELSGSEPDKLEKRMTNDPPMSYDDLVDCLADMTQQHANTYDNKLNRFFINHKLVFESDTQFHEADDIIESDQFIDDMYNKLKSEAQGRAA